MTNVTLSARHEWFRFRFRLEILWRGVLAATLWTAIAIVYTGAQSIGLGPVVIVALLGLLIAGLPILFTQLALLVDAVSFFMIGQIRFFPYFMELTKQHTGVSDDPDFDPRKQYSRATRSFVWAVDALSPFSGPTMWALLVLMRAPAEAHVPVESSHDGPSTQGRELRRIERAVSANAWNRRGLILT